MRPAKVKLSQSALAHNLQVAKKHAGSAAVMAVIKANAYGHGMLQSAGRLSEADGFAVACLDEALALRAANVQKPVLVFQGARSVADYQQAQQHELTLILHHLNQLDVLEWIAKPWPEIWLKVDTGMGRMGVAAEQVEAAVSRLGATCTTLVSHLACADEPTEPLNQLQVTVFNLLLKKTGLRGSLLNSAGLLTLESQYDWVRPGIMLYGSSPVIGVDAAAYGLKPVMTLTAPLIAINTHRAGDAIGYGADYCCEEGMLIGVIAIGYGDGYPRHAVSGTPVLINGNECPLVGRVSMDLLTVDLRPAQNAKIGDLAILWGEGLSVDRIAKMSSTISYELLCNVGSSQTMSN